jgi:pimeloyl-ACP methyl ester carboxylesterase
MSGLVRAQSPTSISKENFYDHEGVKIRFVEIGSGPPVVFLHGFGASLDTWRYVTDALKADHRLVLVDLKGHGLSGRPPDEKYSLKDQAEIVLGLIRHLGFKEVALVGHSYGSIVAVSAALQAGDAADLKVTGLVVIDGALEPQYVPAFLKLLRVPVIGWLTVKLTSAPFRTRFMLLRAFHDDSKVTEELVSLYAGYQTIPGTEHAIMAVAGQIVPDNLPLLRQKLAALNIPVLNVWGEEDIIIKRAGAESVCKILPQCRLVTIPNAGHVPQEETPAQTIPLLRDFLNQISPGAAGEALRIDSSTE